MESSLDKSSDGSSNGSFGKIIVIGASAGALDVLLKILPSLPQGYPVAIVVVVHLPPQKDSLLPQILREKCSVPVEEAEDKMPLQAGTIYTAPPDYHLQLEKNGTFSLSTDEPVHYSRPSIDVLFETVADVFGPGVTGVVLTGASSDGAQGLKAIMAAGGRGLIQDPAQAEVPLMPKAAIKACPNADVMTTDDIAAFFKTIASSHPQMRLEDSHGPG